MKIQLLAFGIARDILGASSLEVELPARPTVGYLKEYLNRHFPQFSTLRSLSVAVNSAYAGDDQEIRDRDEVALIPPVSGG